MAVAHLNTKDGCGFERAREGMAPRLRAFALLFVEAALTVAASIELECPETSDVYDPNTPYQLCEHLFVPHSQNSQSIESK